MKLGRLVAILWIFAAVPSFAADSTGINELYVYPSFQYFQWEEYHAGQRLLKETGPLFGAGAAIGLEGPKLGNNNFFTLKAKGELFGGVIDYDGHAQDLQTGEQFPIKTDVDYFGTKGEADLGWRYTVGQFYLEPFGGLGIRWWLRDLQDTTSTDANGNTVQVAGYQEDWLSAYARVGLRGGFYVSGNVRVFAEGGAKYPFYTRNSTDFPGVGSVTVKPGGRWSAFAELGAQYKWFRPSVFYEGFRYADSPPSSGLFQPESDSDIIGVNLGFAFR
ncbi:MAG TPA: hypothetical protein VFG19_10980 [Geobacteraceae bacterium]|nr:hypothetical protein [Geobacteraceae bacterium]